jgi:HEAT repeat protein
METKIKEKINELIENLEHSDKEAQDKSAKALVEIGDPAVEILIEYLRYREEKSTVHIRVANILSKIGTKKVVDLLLEKLMDYNWRVRTAAAMAIKEIGDSRVIDPLLQILFKDERRDNREYAEVVLGEIGEPVVEQLIQALKDEEPDIRVRAARLLGKIKDFRAVKPLTEVLSKDGNFDVKMVAKRALEKIGVKTE